MNRSFWTAATSSGLVVNSPMGKWFTANDAETIFDRLDAHAKTWNVYVMEPVPLSFTGLIHFPRLEDRLATRFVPPGDGPIVLGPGGHRGGQPVLDAVR
jgi:phospholipase C